MSQNTATASARSTLSLHKLGVFCGLAAAVWLGSAEAPTKLVNEGFSPFLISMGMVMGAFVARWTVPTLLKGTGFLFDDLREKPHLLVWALLAGMLWAVGNTLTIFAVRNVGLAIAFPLWNTNSLVGLAVGLPALQGAARIARERLGQGDWRRAGHCVWRRSARCRHRPAECGRAGQGRHRHHRRTWRGRYVRHHVHSLPQGLYQRHESTFVRHHLHLRRTGNDSDAWLDFLRRHCAHGCRAASGPDHAVLAVSGRILLGHRRSVPAVRGEVHRHRPRHSALQHQPALGTGVGRAGVWQNLPGCREAADC